MTNRLDDIAIISLAGRFPAAKTVEQFWQNLAAGIESVRVFTDAEVLATGVDPDCLRDPSYVKAGGPLEDIECFDATFFSYNPREATLMDPQQRVFLECAWEALERAGYAPSQCPDRVGVYAGVSSNDYWQALQSRPDLTANIGHYQTLLGNDKDFLSSRVSYKLNLKGPSLTVQAACSTSLVATALACQSLLTYQCDMALAGGVSIHIPQTAGYRHQSGGIFSPDGHCRTFDTQAQGTVGGNGVGMVVLKRLDDAIAAGDPIYAVIRGAAINNDGADKVGYTAPSVTGQAAAISEALAFAGINPETLSYIEAHGTGTALGDPIEVAALTQAFNTSKRQFCAIGSVKSNIGHLDAAAGIAGLIKTAMALHHRQMPPSLHFEQPNPQIDFASSPFYVNTQLQDWPTESPRRAGVSAMGIGGTNAHVVLEEAPVRSPSEPSRPWQVLLLSAKTPQVLEQATQNLVQHLESHPEINMADVAYTLQVGRVAFAHRRMLVCQDRDEAITALNANPSGQTALANDQPTVAFLFPGQSAQYVQMARQLYQAEPDFRQIMDDCSEVLKSLLGWDLQLLLYPQPDQVETAQAQLQETEIVQPALFVVEYALAQLWMKWDIQPQALLGHSLGEYVAACLAGIFSLPDALQLVAARGQLMQQMPAGQMLSVALSAAQVQPYLSDGLWLAANNAPQLCVVSGTVAAIATLQTRLEQDKISCRELKTSRAFHSPLMEAALEPFRSAVSLVKLHPPQIPLISNVTGTWMTPEEATNPEYWVNHLRQPVQFSQGVSELLQQQPTVLLEVGPGRTLVTLARQQPLGDTQILTSLRHPQDQVSDTAFLLRTLGQLWLTGVAFDWSVFYAHEQRQRVLLPTYPFERQRYWVESAPVNPTATSSAATPEPRLPIDRWFYLPTWTRSHLPYSSTSGSSRQTWLLFIDEQGVGERLAWRLSAANHTVISVQVGSEFQQQGNSYRLNPSQPEDYQALVQSLIQAGQFPDAIVHGWSLSLSSTAFNLNQFDSDQFNTAQDLGFYSALYLAQAIQQAESSKPLSLWLLTNQVHDVTGAELLRPEQATVVGTHAVISQECPSILCRSLDVVVPEILTTDQISHIVTCLWAELMHPTVDRIIAYRSQHRWTQTFEPLRVPAPEQPPNQLRSQGIYLITGGLAGIGPALAEYLAQTVQAKLAFLEPEALPPHAEWSQWLADQPKSHPVCRKINHIKRLETLGAEVLVCNAEISHLKQVQTAIAQIETHWGALHGVIHTAETTAEASFRPMRQTGRQDCEWQFAPKVKGLQILAEVLAQKSLDFCLVQSSIASQLGGFIAHAAANWFMDALVPALNQIQRTPWISVNWEGWRFWTHDDASTQGVTTTATLSPEEGIETFQRILTLRNIPQVMVSTTDLATRIQQQTHRIERSPSITVASIPTRADAPRNAIEQAVSEIWQDLLGIDQVGIHETFFELGGHSLLGVQVMSRIRETFQAELPLRILLIEQPTVAGLSAEIAAQMSSSDNLDAIQDILDDLEGLSPEDLEALLAKL